MSAYYNEFDPFAAAWLRELIKAGHVAPGDVDERSIKDVQADDIRGYTQCHWFAGIGVWSAALRRAGWDDDRPVWTGSCPCQPFSTAGKQGGFEDPRHLWPDWFRLITERRPDTILGEQSANAGAWLDLVRLDLEGIGAALGAVDIPAAGFGGAHIRQRFYWVANLHDAERWADLAGRHFGDWPQAGRVEGYGESGAGSAAGRLADGSDSSELGRRFLAGSSSETRATNGSIERPEGLRPPERLGHGHGQGLEGRIVSGECGDQRPLGATGLAGADWLWCRDEKFRPVEAGTFPLAASDPGRVGKLRGYGNALDLETATQFIGAYMDAELLA